MKKGKPLHLVTEIIAALLILLFLYSALNKLAGITTFHSVLAQMPGIQHIAWPVAVAIPLVELCTVYLLLKPKHKKTGLQLAAVLLSVFTAYLGYMVIFVPHLPCSCGGVLQVLSWPNHIAFNLFFLILSLVAIPLTRYCNTQQQAFLFNH